MTTVDDFSQLRNTVFVVGGEQEAEERTETYLADGDQEQFPLAYKFSDTPVVEVNDVPVTVGKDGLDDEANFDVMWSFEQKYIKFPDGSPPTVGDKLDVTAKPLFPLIVKVPDVVSINQYGPYEFKLEDRTITDRDTAIERATVELEAYGNSVQEGSFNTYNFGLASGQLINISVGDVSEDFIIQTVTMSMQTPFRPVWKVKLATVRTLGIIQFLQDLLLVNEPLNEAEILLELFNFFDNFEMEDQLNSTFLLDSPPYRYADAVDPNDEGTWNFATWG